MSENISAEPKEAGFLRLSKKACCFHVKKEETIESILSLFSENEIYLYKTRRCFDMDKEFPEDSKENYPFLKYISNAYYCIVASDIKLNVHANLFRRQHEYPHTMLLWGHPVLTNVSRSGMSEICEMTMEAIAFIIVASGLEVYINNIPFDKFVLPK